MNSKAPPNRHLGGAFDANHNQVKNYLVLKFFVSSIRFFKSCATSS